MAIKGNFGSSQDLVEIEDIHDNTVILRDGSLRQIVMVSGINFALRSEEDQNLLISTYQGFLNTLDFPLQILIHSRKINIEKYLNELQARREKEPSPLLQSQIDEYIEFIRQFIKENAIMEKSFFVVIPWYPVVLKKKTKGALSFLSFGKKKKEEKKEEKENDKKAEPKQEDASLDIKKNLPQLKQRVNQVIEGLTTIGLDTVLLDTEQLIELFYNLYNPESIEKEDINLPGEEKEIKI